MPHKASAEDDEASVHLTIGLTAATWEDLAITALRMRCERTPELRRSLPQGWQSDASALGGGLKAIAALLADLLSEDNVSAARERQATELIRNASIPPDGHFTQIAHIGRIGLRTLVEKRTGNLRVARDGDDAMLYFAGNFVSGPGKLSWAFDFIAEAEQFRVGDIPGWYRDEERLTLVKRLVNSGLLRVVRYEADAIEADPLSGPAHYVAQRDRRRP
jgi:hypothetical protein